MTNENFNKLKTLIVKKYSNIDLNTILLVDDIRKRILSKDNDLYLRAPDSGAKSITFGKHKYKAIKITGNKGKELNELTTLNRNEMSVNDPYYKLLNEEIKQGESFYNRSSGR